MIQFLGTSNWRVRYSGKTQEYTYIPRVKLLNLIYTHRMEDPYKMNQESLPYSQLKLMHDINDKGDEDIEVEVLEGV